MEKKDFAKIIHDAHENRNGQPEIAHKTGCSKVSFGLTDTRNYSKCWPTDLCSRAIHTNE